MVPVCVKSNEREFNVIAGADPKRASIATLVDRPEPSLLVAADDAIARTLSDDSREFLELFRQHGGE